MLYQLSYEATHWERGHFVEFISSREEWNEYTYIISLLTGRYELNKMTSLPMCGFIAQLVEHRTGIAEVTGSNPVEALIFFQASSFQLLKLENSLRGSFFTFIYDRSSNIWIISYILTSNDHMVQNPPYWRASSLLERLSTAYFFPANGRDGHVIWPFPRLPFAGRRFYSRRTFFPFVGNAKTWVFAAHFYPLFLHFDHLLL